MVPIEQLDVEFITVSTESLTSNGCFLLVLGLVGMPNGVSEDMIDSTTPRFSSRALRITLYALPALAHG